jgi:peptidoglycan hydrolase-like protein with peptidoglycan-binding domain
MNRRIATYSAVTLVVPLLGAVVAPALFNSASAAPAAALTMSLKSGMRNAQVLTLETRLRDLGVTIKPDTTFNATTKSAVMEMQRAAGLRVSGVVDSATAKALGLAAGKAAAVPPAMTPAAVRGGVASFVVPVLGVVSGSLAARHPIAAVSTIPESLNMPYAFTQSSATGWYDTITFKPSVGVGALEPRRALLAHEFGHVVGAGLGRKQAQLYPPGFPVAGYGAEAFADCVVRALTGTTGPTYLAYTNDHPRCNDAQYHVAYHALLSDGWDGWAMNVDTGARFYNGL